MKVIDMLNKDTLLSSIVVHYGVLGMRWGVRRRRSSSSSGSSTSKKIKDMSDDELNSFVKRLTLEKTATSLTATKSSRDKTMSYLKDAATVTTSVSTIIDNVSKIKEALK